ncbi:hypothetical protein K2X85_18715 [bacterium]|nr:hypothetical protein [bacterium]
MRLRHFRMSLTRWAAGALLISSVWTGSASAQDPTNGVAFLKQRVFRIPIEVAAERTEAIKELRLFVSTDQGSTWTRVASVAPSQRSFTFRSRADGEYWFGLSYVDESGRAEPEDMRQQQPGLKVVVDTAQPVLQMRPTVREQDKAGIEWRILDDQPIELSSLRIEYRDKREGRWQDLHPDAMIEGRIDWPASADQSFVVRATIEDRAGNVGSTEVEVPAVTIPSMPIPSLPATSNPAPPAVPIPEANNPPAASASAMPSGFTVPPPPSFQPLTTPPAAVAAQIPTPTAPAVPAGQPDHLVAKPSAPTANQVGYQSASEPAVYNPAIPIMTNARPSQTTVQVASPETVAGNAADRTMIASTATPVRPVPHVVRKPEAPPAPKIPIVGSTRFAVDYALRGIGPAGVGKVDLYYTKDNGVQWLLLGEDADKTPPFEVDLPGEGRYGLAVVVSSPAGNGQRPPQSGDAPTIQVEVDTTAPEAELYRPTPDPAAPAEAMLISWSARDTHLSDRPVRLYYAPQADGPWEPIGTDLPASGQYRWFVPPRTPYQVYLRLAVSDLCNNESAAVTPEPVLVDLSKPEAEVIGIAILPEGQGLR